MSALFARFRSACLRGERAAFRIALVSLTLAACAAERRAPPAAPLLASALDPIPSELDVVVRVDVARVRAALGAETLAALRRGFAAAGDETERLLGDAIERADVFVAAARYDDRLVDHVVAVQGDFRGIRVRPVSSPGGWQAPVDLGGDVVRYDREPKGRNDPARIYVRSYELVVVVSEAAVDSVEAVIERGAPPNRLAPPERGIVSAALRIRPGANPFGLRERLPLLGDLLAGARSLEGFVDGTPDGFRLEVGCELATAPDAARAVEVLDGVRSVFGRRDDRAGALARLTTIEAAGAHVVVRAELARDVLDGTLGEVLE